MGESYLQIPYHAASTQTDLFLQDRIQERQVEIEELLVNGIMNIPWC